MRGWEGALMTKDGVVAATVYRRVGVRGVWGGWVRWRGEGEVGEQRQRQVAGEPEGFATDGDGREWVFRWGDSCFREDLEKPVDGG